MGISTLKVEAQKAIRVTKKALAKHIRLIKKKERITSVVATLERLAGDIRSDNAKAIRTDLKKLNELTKGFVERQLTAKKKPSS